MALVEVRDDGPGIVPEVCARLFQPFVTAGKKNGLGLGLALSRQTVIDHGGDIKVESAAGCGTTFFLRLPLRVPIIAEIERPVRNGTVEKSNIKHKGANVFNSSECA
jgi:signal transduction histidine kinase